MNSMVLVVFALLFQLLFQKDLIIALSMLIINNKLINFILLTNQQNNHGTNQIASTPKAGSNRLHKPAFPEE